MATGLLIRIDPGDGLPIYRQIVEQVKAAIAAGVLGPGDRLPSHRDLARDVVVAPLTVSRAYDLLEREGFIATVRGRGTFVTPGSAEAAAEAARALRGRADALVRQAQALGLSRREVLSALQDAWREGGERQDPGAATEPPLHPRPGRTEERTPPPSSGRPRRGRPDSRERQERT